MKELFLHIGTQKTGTTSIQSFLKLNRVELEKNKIYTPKSIDIGNGHHRWITTFGTEENKVDAFIANQEFSSKEEKNEKIKKKFVLFKNEIERNDEGKWIISCEHMQSELRTEDEITRLKNKLEKLFTKINIILYIRNPLDTVVSLWSTQTKFGAKLTRIAAPDDPFYENVCNHKKTIIKWENVFGRENLKVLRFQKEDFFNKNLFEDFCLNVGIDFNKNFKFPPRTNQSLSLIGMKSLGYINNFIPHFEERKDMSSPLKLNKERNNIASYIEKYTLKGETYNVSEEEELKFCQYYKDSDDWVLREFFPNDKKMWNTERKFKETDNNEVMKLTRSEQMLCNIIIKLWKERNASKYNTQRFNDLEIKL